MLNVLSLIFLKLIKKNKKTYDDIKTDFEIAGYTTTLNTFIISSTGMIPQISLDSLKNLNIFKFSSKIISTASIAVIKKGFSIYFTTNFTTKFS